jgi:hypothetical protein
MKIKFAALALLVSGAFCCSDSSANDLLGRMLGRGGCGCDAAPTCCDTPAANCGGRTLSININMPGRGFLSGLRGRGLGCGSYADAGCGCDAPIGGGCCDQGHGCGLGGRLRGRLGGLFNRGGDGCCDMGCGNACDQGCAAAPVAAPVAAGCGCNGGAVANNCCDPCQGSGGLLSGLGGRFRGHGCGSGNACGDSGCAAAPVAAGCGCNGGSMANDCCDPCGCGNGFLSGLRGRLGSRHHHGGWGGDCGCAAAPVAAGCGCNGGSMANDCCDPCGRGGRMGLLSRLRSGHGHHGCGMADNACGCAAAPVAAGCGCNGGAVPVQGAPMQAAPMDAAPQGNGDVVAPPDAGANRIKTPNVDPNSFIIRNTGYRN